MTKKDFELIAYAMRKARIAKGLIGGPAHQESVDLVAESLADALSETNQLFNIPRFLEACK